MASQKEMLGYRHRLQLSEASQDTEKPGGGGVRNTMEDLQAEVTQLHEQRIAAQQAQRELQECKEQLSMVRREADEAHQQQERAQGYLEIPHEHSTWTKRKLVK